MPHVPSRFPHNDIMTLTSSAVRFDLAESLGPDLRLGQIFADGFGAELEDLALAYGPTDGSAALRQLIAARHGVDADDVITTVGAMQALFLIAFILGEPGAGVVIGRPVFPNARSVLDAVRMDVVELPMRFDDGYRLDVDRLRSLLTPRTRLVSLASPQNPSGVALTGQEVRGVLACMQEICPDAFLLVDETYREAVHGDGDARPSLVGLDRRIVSCASFSKCHGAPGIRTGWVITQDRALRAQLEFAKFNTTISNSVVDEAIALRIMQTLDPMMRDRRRHLAAGLARTAAFVEAHADMIEWVRPDAGALCCVRLRRDVFDDAAVVRFHGELAARETRVGPGSWFGDEPRVFRLGFGLLTLPDLDEALGRIAQALRQAA
ncbi:pyridoxal phosphate-dependent aminotransferase [Bradyrhizobium ontarionense]|uniref:Pyridoxal phosphate-dependent aminotransferase n=1 Tax=Bradyrhizobium ontarionense TaxID=2898149 RepID=A0ABY3RDP4_9BRAD|nr:pyridoxal phosphate-dependent aminotransferase [Bradyrhizobium sp. A19]UFZ05506.1 pyridoxal phosphate-dependent aminotransferase [Bradyrhizobium sp. A19]